MSRLLTIFNVLGPVIVFFGLSMLLPFAISHLIGDGAHAAYLRSGAMVAILGCGMWLVTLRFRRELAVRDGFLFVVLVWTVLPAFGTLPLMAQLPQLGFTDAYFEAVSGLTASGATVLSGLDALPPSINVWRALMVWQGGLGVVVLAVAILPLLGVGGSQVFKAEIATPIKDTKLTPRIAETAKGLWLVYVLLTALCMVAYRLAGMSWIDALIHALTTLGLGGFSSHDASFGYWDSPRIEAVAIVFMLIASINFTTHFLVWRRRSAAPYRNDPEARWVLFTMLGGAVLVAAFLLWRGTYGSFGESLRYAAFNVISVASTTGYANTDYALWPVFAPVWMLFLSCFATSSGSTGAGIKMIRALILTKQSLREFTRILHPRAFVPLKVGGATVENNLIFAVLAYMLIYGGTAMAMTLAMTASGLDPVTAFSAVMACLNNMGPGLGAVGPASTYAVLNDFQTWLCTITMMLGRLELMTMLVVFTPAFWRK